MAPVEALRVASTWCHCPSLIEVAEVIVVSGLPTPNAALAPTNDTPKSSAAAETSPSTRPLPAHHWPVLPVSVVLTHNAMVKSLSIERGTVAYPDPSNWTAPPSTLPATVAVPPTNEPLRAWPLLSRALPANG